MVKHKNLSSCACVFVFLSNVILAIQQGIQQPNNAPTQPSTQPGFVRHAGYAPSPYPHHMPLPYGMQPNPYMMPMMDPDYLDHRMDMAKDMAKQRYAMNMYRQSYPPMGMYPGYPYQQSRSFGPGHHSAPMSTAGGRHGSSPRATQSTQNTQPTSGPKRLSRKKRFVPMMPVPFAPFGGFAPMLGVLRGAAVAGNMAMVHRVGRMRALAARRNRNGFNQNSRTRGSQSTVSRFNPQSNRPMDSSFNAIDNAVARSTGAQPTVVQQLVPQPLSQPFMTQNIISQPGQQVISDPILSQPALTQNIVVDQPSIVDPSGLGGQQQIIVDNGLGGQQQAIVDNGLTMQPQVIVDPRVVGQQQVAIDNTLAGQQQQILDQQAVNEQLAAQTASNKQLDAALQLQMDVQQAINQQTSQLAGSQLASQNAQQLYNSVGQQIDLQQANNQQSSPQVAFDVLNGQQSIANQPQSSQQIFNLQPNINQQALDQQALDQQIVNQQPLNQQTFSQPALNPQPFNHPSMNQQAFNQPALNQQAFNQPTLNQGLDQQALNQQSMNQQVLEQQTLNQQILNQQAFNQPALDQQLLNQQILNQQALNQPAFDQQALNQQILSQPALGTQPFDVSQSISGQQQSQISNAQQSVSNPMDGMNIQIQNVMADLAASQTSALSSSQSNAVDVGSAVVQPQQPSNQQLLIQQPGQQAAGLSSLAFPELLSFNDPSASNIANTLQLRQAQAAEPVTTKIAAGGHGGGGGGGPPQPPTYPSQTGQQANLATLDLIANLASLNQRGMIPKHQGRPFNL
ncbi:hypothetical protein LOTGIDRAFT_228238 [Lottia gigantea]|uniref:Uncharacterized protein n=1 Tax=Lottia gigantea TaxID=225164 RepID=V4A1A2_LOTGI|nr:hypothetical protein LOTGIDRAFT_228238 [Lottia gigantea]ESO97603.1 hypothetical protein LOTGIDRAFT_228238 [Lottia gigantea]